MQTGKDERSRWPLLSEVKEGTCLEDWALTSHLRPEVPTTQRCSRGSEALAAGPRAGGGVPSPAEGRAAGPLPRVPQRWRQTFVPTASRLQMTTFPLPEKKQCYDYIFNSLACDPAARVISRG